MFDGVPDQLHQFIASSRSSTTASSLPLPLSSFPLHASPSPNTTAFSPFDAYSHNHHQHQVPLQPHHHQLLLQPLHHNNPPPSAQKISHDEKGENNNNNLVNSVNFEIDHDRDSSRSIPSESISNTQPWSNDEVLALLRIRSTMENWFPEYTWEHISRKLAELGFKRSAVKCKEKYEEESRYFNNINYMKNFRFLTELEQLYHGDHHHHNPQVGAHERSQKVPVVDKPSDQIGGEEEEEEEGDKRGQSVEKDLEDNDEEKMMMGVEERSLRSKKRKRHKDNFEIFKDFCEGIVKKMMAQQEEMHNKLLEDMVKRDEEKVAKEEAWKKQEMVRMNKELETMAQEQAIAIERQATIIEFLKKFTSINSTSSCGGKILKTSNPVIPPTPSSSSSIQPLQNPNPTSTSQTVNPQEDPISSCRMIMGHHLHQSSNSSTLVETQNPSSNPTTTTTLPSSISFDTQKKPFTKPTSVSSPTQNKVQQKPISSNYEIVKDDVGKRWPRDEVLALINLRCSMYNNGSDDKEGGVKAPLWERISQGMKDLGYKRSAKRCKEKWENINKYFRKTKDNVNKKRSIDSRTCPYFHQLSTLYNQGTIASPLPHCSSAAAASPSETTTGGHGGDSSQVVPSSDSCLHVNGGGDHHDQGERNMVQVSAAFDFEF